MSTISMPLLNDRVDVWRPVEATLLWPDTYRVEGSALIGFAVGSTLAVLIRGAIEKEEQA